MRFSKKRAAQDMLKHLQYARNEAVVVKGMGLGKVNSKGEEQEEEEEGEDEAEEQGKETGAERLVVKDKDGKKRVITDRSAMYVDEAWVGRGTPDHATDFRAMGKSARMDLPFTSKLILFCNACDQAYSRIRRVGRLKGRDHKDPISGGKRAEATTEEGLGTVGGSADNGAKTVPSLVIPCIFLLLYILSQYLQ